VTVIAIDLQSRVSMKMLIKASKIGQPGSAFLRRTLAMPDVRLQQIGYG
jgi:hypothetical protein